MTIVIANPKFEVIPGTTSETLIDRFEGYSDVLKRWFDIEKGFVCDTESTPWKGENPIAGLVHDYFSRKDSLPIVSKITAARIYCEFQRFEDEQRKRPWYTMAHDCLWRGIKSSFVAVCPDFVYWHKYSVNATYEDMSK